jgi:DNA-binding beta-propeller fold protein YncE
MHRTPKLMLAGVLVAAVSALAVGQSLLEARASSQAVEVPLFEVDPLWPQPLPNHWILGSVLGVGVDSRDHVFIVHTDATLDGRTELGAVQDPPLNECCTAAPRVLEFDPEGNLVNAWGGPGDGYVWPNSNHGLTVDPMDNIWIGGNADGDSHILKFTRDGRLLLQVGEPGQGVDSNDTTSFGRAAKISFGPDGEEAFVSDGYGNRRVAVIDSETGEFLRYWGAYGNTPSDEDIGTYDPDAEPAQQFRTVHCAEPSHDGLIYVCDRANDRIQVFQADGSFLTEAFVAPETLGDGSVFDIAFSRDPEQRFIYLAEGANKRVRILERETLQILTSFGDGGRQPGQFVGVHSIATDSQGNIYTTETYEGKRVQKFVYLGMGSVSEPDQGVVWPNGSAD